MKQLLNHYYASLSTHTAFNAVILSPYEKPWGKIISIHNYCFASPTHCTYSVLSPLIWGVTLEPMSWLFQQRLNIAWSVMIPRVLRSNFQLKYSASSTYSIKTDVEDLIYHLIPVTVLRPGKVPVSQAWRVRWKTTAQYKENFKSHARVLILLHWDTSVDIQLFHWGL